ncbi:MAG: hypothetical protein ACIAQZ_01625 [Sedimentisphaeraceae bacterium JB056]
MFKFDYYSISNATRKAAGALLAVGLLLLGIGILVIVLKAVFIVIAAGLIFFAALWCIGTAIKMFIQIGHSSRDKYEDPEKAYRKNVRIHNSESFDDY